MRPLPKISATNLLSNLYFVWRKACEKQSLSLAFLQSISDFSFTNYGTSWFCCTNSPDVLFSCWYRSCPLIGPYRYSVTPNEGEDIHNIYTGEYKSNDGLMNQEYPHSVQEPIAEGQRPWDIPSKPRILWPKGNLIATWTNLDQELSFCSPPILRAPLINK